MWNTCRICKDYDTDLLRYGTRHYCHAECGFSRWGAEFLRKIPAHEIGCVPYRLLADPERRKIALELCPANLRTTIQSLTEEATRAE